MAFFQYKAVSPSGEVQEGVLEASSTPAAIEMGGPPALSARANPLDANGDKTPNTVTLSMARARGAAYRVQLTQDTVNDPPTGWADAAGPITNQAGIAQANPVVGNTSNPLVLNVAGLTNGTTYKARIIPEYGGVPNTPSLVATFTINN